MFHKICDVIEQHVKNNKKLYFLLLLSLIVGVSAGAFTVNGLSSIQREELVNYFNGFLQLMDNQKIENVELFKISLLENLKIIIVIWFLGVTIIGIPLIFIVIGIKGFITGFSVGFIIGSLGNNGIIFTLLAILPKEMIILPSIIALGVNGINFSLKIIKNKSIKHISKDSLRANFASYCFVTAFFTCFILVGVLIEAYITPNLIKIISPIITN